MTRTSVLEGLSESKLADIQLETLEKTAWSWLTETVKSSGEKKTKSWVSSAYIIIMMVNRCSIRLGAERCSLCTMQGRGPRTEP